MGTWGELEEPGAGDRGRTESMWAILTSAPVDPFIHSDGWRLTVYVGVCVCVCLATMIPQYKCMSVGQHMCCAPLPMLPNAKEVQCED